MNIQDVLAKCHTSSSVIGSLGQGHKKVNSYVIWKCFMPGSCIPNINTVHSADKKKQAKLMIVERHTDKQMNKPKTLHPTVYKQNIRQNLKTGCYSSSILF